MLASRMVLDESNASRLCSQEGEQGMSDDILEQDHEQPESSLEEQAYMSGARMQLRKLLGFAIRELVSFDTETDPQLVIARLLAEREDAVAALRRVCAGHGDNDWTVDLHLADVIEKHLERHLED
jgi:hypothetical protein